MRNRSLDEEATKNYLVSAGYSRLPTVNSRLTVPVIWVVSDDVKNQYFRDKRDKPDVAMIQPPAQIRNSPNLVVYYPKDAGLYQTDYYAILPDGTWKLVTSTKSSKTTRRIPNRESLFYSDPGKAPLL